MAYFFPLSLVTVPEVFASVNSAQFPLVSKVVNMGDSTQSFVESSSPSLGYDMRFENDRGNLGNEILQPQHCLKFVNFCLSKYFKNLLDEQY